MLDDRWYRTPEKSPETAVQLGPQQMQWLKDGLSSSLATFKIICIGGQVLNELWGGECFERAPAEKAELLEYIVKAKISGVVFLSGDRHLSELLVKAPTGGYPLYDFTCSPLTSGATRLSPGKNGQPNPEQANPLRVKSNGVECLTTGTRNFGKVQVTGKAAERKLILSCHDKTGAELWKHEIKAADLK
jgi:alkaline phosphatase D